MDWRLVSVRYQGQVFMAIWCTDWFAPEVGVCFPATHGLTNSWEVKVLYSLEMPKLFVYYFILKYDFETH